MEKSRNYRVLVKQVDRFSYEFAICASSEGEAKGIVEKMLNEEPLDCRKNTFDNTDVEMEIIATPIQIHTVEALFDIDKDITDEEVILLDDLSEKQRLFLGLVREDAPSESGKTFAVLSSGGSLKVDFQTGLVVECTTCRNEDNDLKDIVRFDIEEYKAYYGISEIPADLDILDLGYWNMDGGYEKPVQDWRNEMRRVE
jgi:hypothetical protein